MDKIFRSSWFIKIISFLIALMLYNVVSSNEIADNNDNAFSFTTGNQKATMTEELEAKYDHDKYIVMGLPKTVDLLLRGTSEQITKAKLLATRRVYVDLTGKKPGTYRVKVLTAGFPAGLHVEPNPSSIRVTIQRKVTKNFSVNVDFLNKNDLANGYQLGDAKIDPAKVAVTGAEDIVNRIAFVKGIVDVQDASDTIRARMALNAYDKDGNQLNVLINPGIARVEVPLVHPSKEVAVDIHPTGHAPNDKSVASIDVDPQTVKVYGKKEVLNSIDKITLNLALNRIDHSGAYEVKVPVPSGADKVEPDKVTVNVTFKEDEKKTVKNVPIAVEGLDDPDQTVAFISPKDRMADVVLIGDKNAIDAIKPSDIQLIVDLAGLGEGEHEVEIKVKGPKNVEIRPVPKTAKVRIGSGSG